MEFDAFWPENLTSGGTNFSFSLTFTKILSPDLSLTTQIP